MGESTLVRVCGVDDVDPGGAKRYAVGERLIAVANLGVGGFRAVDAVCSHAHYYLDEGDVDVDDETIECPKHGSTFDLNTGRPTTLPATVPVETYRVKVEGDDVLIEVDP
jgi:3-phenylpropionate/trans-cinnamate dioxygenase ferredoxin component